MNNNKFKVFFYFSVFVVIVSLGKDTMSRIFFAFLLKASFLIKEKVPYRFKSLAGIIFVCILFAIYFVSLQ